MALAFLAASMAVLDPGLPQAEPRLLRVPLRFALIAPQEEGSRALNRGDILFDYPLVWQEGAVPQVSITAQLDQRSIRVEAGQPLVRTQIAFSQPALAAARAYCVPRRAEPPVVPLGLFGAMLARAASDGQFCALDTDQDGSFDQMMLLNAGSPEARTPRSMPATPFRVQEGAEAGAGDRLQIVYAGGSAFTLRILQQGKPRRFTELSYSDVDGRHVWRAGINGRKQGDGSFGLEVPGRHLRVVPDASRRSAIVRWSATARAQAIPIPDEVVARPY